jgi:hypothetical protein
MFFEISGVDEASHLLPVYLLVQGEDKIVSEAVKKKQAYEYYGKNFFHKILVTPAKIVFFPEICLVFLRFRFLMVEKQEIQNIFRIGQLICPIQILIQKSDKMKKIAFALGIVFFATVAFGQTKTESMKQAKKDPVKTEQVKPVEKATPGTPKAKKDPVPPAGKKQKGEPKKATDPVNTEPDKK